MADDTRRAHANCHGKAQLLGRRQRSVILFFRAGTATCILCRLVGSLVVGEAALIPSLSVDGVPVPRFVEVLRCVGSTREQCELNARDRQRSPGLAQMFSPHMEDHATTRKRKHTPFGEEDAAVHSRLRLSRRVASRSVYICTEGKPGTGAVLKLKWRAVGARERRIVSLGCRAWLASYWALLTLCASSGLGRMTSVACTILRSDDIAHLWLDSSHQRAR
eukprot:scaffold395_cov133-Isochrysis_galbana.AAC.9